MQEIPKSALIFLLQAYRQLISPWLGSACRYHPSCSQYAIDAIAAHGAFVGAWFSIKRVGRCHPWHAGGFDPAPPKNN